MLTTRKTKNRELFDLPDFRSEHSHSQFTSSLRVTQWLAADRQATKTVQVFIIYIYRVYKKKVIELQRAIVSELLCV